MIAAEELGYAVDSGTLEAARKRLVHHGTPAAMGGNLVESLRKQLQKAEEALVSGGYGGNVAGGGGMQKGKRGKGKTGGKAGGGGKGPGPASVQCQVSPYNFPEPCYRCTMWDHSAPWCPFKKDQCNNCNKVGHLAIACTAEKNQSKKCKCCGSIGHVKESCPHLSLHCPNCKKQGHVESMCWHKNNAAPVKKMDDQEPAPMHHLGATMTWCCAWCDRWLGDKTTKCTGCGRKRLDLDEAKAAAAAPAQAPSPKKEQDDQIVQNWSTSRASEGAPLTKEDQDHAELVDKTEKLIEIYKTMPSETEEVKKLEAKLVTLNKKKPLNTIARDHISLARISKEAEERADRKLTAARAALQKKMDARDEIVGRKAGALARMKEEHERQITVHEKQFKLQTDDAEQAVLEERKKVEEAEVELTAEISKKKGALANVSAANTANGATLVPVAPGSIVHSNDVCPDEMCIKMLQEPGLQGLSKDQAAAVTQFSLQFINSKSMAVVPATLAPTVQSINGLPDSQVQQSAPAGGSAEDDELTDVEVSDTEDDAERANQGKPPGAKKTKQMKKGDKKRLELKREDRKKGGAK